MAKQIKIIFKCFLCLALGVLVLQGCQTGNYISKSDMQKSVNAYNNPIKTNTKKISTMVIGEVIGIYINNKCIKNGRIDSVSMRYISRMGYSEYSTISSKFNLKRPK